MYYKSIQEQKNEELVRLAKQQESRDRTKKRVKEEAKKYINEVHDFTMYHGNIKTPIKAKMTGREAKLKNDLNVIKYGAGKSGKLIRWVAVDVLKERYKNKESVGNGVGVETLKAESKDKFTVYK